MLDPELQKAALRGEIVKALQAYRGAVCERILCPGLQPPTPCTTKHAVAEVEAKNALLTAFDSAIDRARLAALQEADRAAAAEEELTGAMPDEVMVMVLSDPEGVLRQAVRTTKAGIRARIDALIHPLAPAPAGGDGARVLPMVRAPPAAPMPPAAGPAEGKVAKGGQNLSYQITQRPPDPPPMRPGAGYQPLPGPGVPVKPPPRKP